MHPPRTETLWAVALSVALHAAVLGLAGLTAFTPPPPTAPVAPPIFVEMWASEPPAPSPDPTSAPSPPRPAAAPARPVPVPAMARPTAAPPAPQAPDRERAYLDAPPAPTAEEWALASRYTLKNSKRYRHTWGQQVRSLMGTAFEGPDQGAVRFRVEIAPDGRMTRLETLWSTSPVAEQRARQAMDAMPPLPPTPTGQPLVFEKTISFQPHVVDDTPLYQNDCLPERPAFRNPYAWDGQSDPGPAVQPRTEQRDGQAMADCLRQLPQDTIEAESAHDRRQLERWGSDRLGR